MCQLGEIARRRYGWRAESKLAFSLFVISKYLGEKTETMETFSSTKTFNSCIHLFILVWNYVHTNTSLCIVMLNYLSLANGSPAIWLCVLLTCPIIIWALCCFQIQWDFLGSSCIFLVLESVVSSRNLPPTLSPEEWYLEAEIWALDVLIAIGWCCARRSQWNMCIYTYM